MTREQRIFAAKVLLTEAARRRHDPAFHALLLRWAGDQRFRAMKQAGT